MNAVRWNIAVSPDSDHALRLFLASQGRGKKGDISRFVEEAVRAHILALTAEQAKSANTNVNEDDLADIIQEAIEWARKK